MIQTRSAVLSDLGQKRSNNEDFVAFFEPTDPQEQAKNGSLYIVADGVGGAAKGERASQYAAEKLLYEYYNLNELEPGERLRQVISRINEEIFNFAEQSTTISQMATTLVAAVVRGNMLTVANVGDSRAYLIRAGTAQQITRDHSIVGELVRDGEMTEAQAQASKMKNSLTRSLGGEDEVHVDIFPNIPLQSGDKVLLCTDGLTRYALSKDIASLTAEGSPGEIVQGLVDYANQCGGVDNISVILVDTHVGLADEMRTLPAHKPQPVSWETMETTPLLPQPRARRRARRTFLNDPKRYIPYAVVAVLLLAVFIGGKFMFGPVAGLASETPPQNVLAAQQESAASIPPTATPTATATPTPTSTLTPTPESPQECVYTVQQNDTLGLGIIAEKLKTTWGNAICSPNPDTLCTDKTIILPGQPITFFNVLPTVCQTNGGVVPTLTPTPSPAKT